MGKNQRIRKEKRIEEGKKLKAEIKSRKMTNHFWSRFWLEPVFWIYTICVLALVAYPVFGYGIRQQELSTHDEAVIHTSLGDITVKLYNADAPKTADNFIQLARKNYYSNTTFHRVIKSFMIQGGDPKGDGTGGESTWGGTFADEINANSLGLSQLLVRNATFLQSPENKDELSLYAGKSVKEYYESKGFVYNPDLHSHKMVKGSVAVANSGPNTNGSQFFIVTEKAQPHLDGKHTVFGEVVSGMDIAVKISEVEVDKDSKPLSTVSIKSVEIR